MDENGSWNEGKTQFVVSREEQGFRVYSPSNRTLSYLVTGTLQNPKCTCSEYNNGNAAYCQHIEAARTSFGNRNVKPDEDRYAAEERRAIQGEDRTAGSHNFSDPKTPGTQMLVKRSVSPDGRIDSLSIEFSTTVDESLIAAVSERATRLLALQAEIAKGFLNGAKNGNNGHHVANGKENGDSGAALAEMVNIGGMDGKWGRRLFINLQSDGRSLRLFGNKTQLAEAIRSAGITMTEERIVEGVALRVPCRVITKPSPDGKYVNVERVVSLGTPAITERNGR